MSGWIRLSVIARTIGLLDTRTTQLLGHHRRSSDEKGRKIRRKEKR
jgi:hypothetical protein